MLDIYLTVKHARRYDEELENRLFAELQWLDDMIVKNLDDTTRKSLESDGFNYLNQGMSQYYWNDMMRRIVIGQLAPLCLRSGYTTRALQYLNMADYRITELVNMPAKRQNYELTIKDFEYRNDYFINLDSVGVRYVERLANRMEHPKSPLDKFLNERSLNSPQYLYDIIGTQLIARMEYRKAIPFLKKVSTSFNKERNVYAHCNIDPFSGERLKQPDEHYKLHFAEAMYALEQTISKAIDPNDKAEAMLKYAYGMQNSVGIDCWPLTSYYWGDFYCYPFYSRYVKGNIEKITRKYAQIKERAFTLFSDQERAAKAYNEWKMYKTLVDKYPDSKAAQYVKGHCDVLRDYQIRPAQHPRIHSQEQGYY